MEARVQTRLRAMFTPERVVDNVDARSKKHALEILAELLARADQGLTQTDAFEALVGRERLGGTAIGGGVALPHGRVEDLDQPVAACIQLTTPVDYDAEDGQPVDLLIGILIPADQEQEGGNIVERTYALLNTPGVSADLRGADTSSELYRRLTALDETSQAAG